MGLNQGFGYVSMGKAIRHDEHFFFGLSQFLNDGGSRLSPWGEIGLRPDLRRAGWEEKEDKYQQQSLHVAIVADFIDDPLTVNDRSPYNQLMTRKTDQAELVKRANAIMEFYHDTGRMPSFSEIGTLIGVSSKNAVFKVVAKLQKQNLVVRDKTGRLLPPRQKHALRVLGSVEAGFPSPAEEELADTLSLDDLMVKNKEATFLLKVSGDSMSGVGIMPGDMVIIDRSVSPKSGDIVIAEVDGAWTMKRLKKQGDNVVLIAANPNYKPIYPKSELKIAGVVTGVVRKYQ